MQSTLKKQYTIAIPTTTSTILRSPQLGLQQHHLLQQSLISRTAINLHVCNKGKRFGKEEESPVVQGKLQTSVIIVRNIEDHHVSINVITTTKIIDRNYYLYLRTASPPRSL